MTSWHIDRCSNPSCDFSEAIVSGSETSNIYEIGFTWTCPTCGHRNYSEIPGPLGDWDDWPDRIWRVPAE